MRISGLLALLALLLTGALTPLMTASAALPPMRSSVTLANLRTEYKTNPLGIDARLPRFSWELRSSERGVVQSAYEIRVKDETPGSKDRGQTVWNTGKVASDASIQVAYAGQNLESGHRYVWQVRVWDGDGEATAWSEPASFEMGMLEPSDWQAQWITPAWDEDTTKSVPPALLRSTFNVDGRIASARAY
ncbi:MAG TPA: hypothetical protein VFG50_06660, partial [Rhodothermales bacterium]|nr:hypothetical protein [Rhodothermales bacterium]